MAFTEKPLQADIPRWICPEHCISAWRGFSGKAISFIIFFRPWRTFSTSTSRKIFPNEVLTTMRIFFHFTARYIGLEGLFRKSDSVSNFFLSLMGPFRKFPFTLKFPQLTRIPRESRTIRASGGVFPVCIISFHKANWSISIKPLWLAIPHHTHAHLITAHHTDSILNCSPLSAQGGGWNIRILAARSRIAGSWRHANLPTAWTCVYICPSAGRVLIDLHLILF